MSAIGAYIEEQLRLRGWQQIDLEARSEVSNTTISALIAGKGTRKPSPATLVKLAKAFSDPPEKLLILAGYSLGVTTDPDALDRERLILMQEFPLARAIFEEAATLPPNLQSVVLGVVRTLAAQQTAPPTETED